MAEIWRCCCWCSSSTEEEAETPRDITKARCDFTRETTPENERKIPELPLDDYDPRGLDNVKRKLTDLLPENTSYEYICSQAKKYVSPTHMEDYFFHLVSGTAGNAVLEATRELETSFTHTWERAMMQRRSLKRFQTVVNFPVKLILCDLQRALPPFASSFAKMIQLEFGALHAALVIDDVVIEWDDSSLILPSVEQKEWVFQATLCGDYNKVAEAMKPEMRDSAKKMNVPKQIEQVFEATKEKQQAINQLIQLIIHYNQNHEYSVLTRNCQHFVLDAMKVLGVEKVPQFSGVFQSYFSELTRGKSKDIIERFDTHAALDEHVDTIIQPGLSQHDLEYLLCQYFMFHVSSRKKSPHGLNEDWKCEEESCRMNEIEDILEKCSGSLLFTTFSLNSPNSP